MAQKTHFKGILDIVGNTPLVRIPTDTTATILAKLEYLNPSGSLKDRSALYMIEQAEKAGVLKPGGTIVEASSGNQGIALAMIGALKGYKVIITVPDRTSVEKVATLRAYGAEVHVCPEGDHTATETEGYHAKAQQLVQQIPGAFMPNQYFNLSNATAHYTSTGPEIWEQTKGTVTHFIVGAGTCGTVSGAGRYLKEQNPAIKVIGVDAETSAYSSKNPQKYKVEGIGIDAVSDILKAALIDEVIPVTDDDAFAMCKKLAKQGFLVGLSTGAVMHGALMYAKTLTENDVIVVIFGDSGRAYLSKLFLTQQPEQGYSSSQKQAQVL